MHRAIAGGGWVCQAAVLVIVFLLLCPLARGQVSVDGDGTYFEARTPDNVLVREHCSSGAGAATVQSPCGTLAKQAVDIITRLSALLGPFPERALILEYASSKGRLPERFAVATLGRIRAAPEMMAYAADDIYIPDFLPREIARQWFLLPASRWRVSDKRLAEGLPEYLAWRYLQQARSEMARVLVAEAMRDSVAGSREQPAFGFLGERTGEDRALIVSSRQRGLLVMRTLETAIDRERVDRVLPEFIRRYGGGIFSTANLKKVCEEIAGRDLGWFFRYFFDGQGIPEIELQRQPSEAPGVVAGEILVRGLPPEGSVRVEMTVRTAQGNVEHSVATRGEVTPFTVNVPAPALEIILDPGQRILRWTEAARKSQIQSQILGGLPNPITRKNVSEAIALYRRALEADPGDASLRAQTLRERLGELEWAHDEGAAALADLEAAINGHSIAPFETYLTRGKAYLYHGVVSLHEQRPRDALEDVRAGLVLPPAVLAQVIPREPVESSGTATLRQLFEILEQAAAQD